MNPSYTHIRYSFTQLFTDLYFMITAIVLTAMSIQSVNNTLVVLGSVLASLTLCGLIVRYHTHVRRRYFASLADRVILARHLHRDPELGLWRVAGVSASGEWVKLQNVSNAEEQFEVRLSVMYQNFTMLDPNYNEADHPE